MKTKGRVWKFGHNIDTDLIIPARYLVSIDIIELARHCLEGLKPGFPEKVEPGDVILAGRNFGSGSSREHAPLAIKATGISAVIAVSFARIFFRNAINIGLPIIEMDKIEEFQDQDLIELDLEEGVLRNLTQNRTYNFPCYPQFLQEIIKAGGLMQWAKRRR